MAGPTPKLLCHAYNTLAVDFARHLRTAPMQYWAIRKLMFNLCPRKRFRKLGLAYKGSWRACLMAFCTFLQMAKVGTLSIQPNSALESGAAAMICLRIAKLTGNQVARRIKTTAWLIRSSSLCEIFRWRKPRNVWPRTTMSWETWLTGTPRSINSLRPFCWGWKYWLLAMFSFSWRSRLQEAQIVSICKASVTDRVAHVRSSTNVFRVADGCLLAISQVAGVNNAIIASSDQGSPCGSEELTSSASGKTKFSKDKYLRWFVHCLCSMEQILIGNPRLWRNGMAMSGWP